MTCRSLTRDEVVEMSGAFVLGALEAAEDAAVRRHLATCELDHTEIAELGSVLPVLDASVPLVEPRDGLKARILAAAAAEAAQAADARGAADRPTPRPLLPAAPAAAAVVTAPPPRRRSRPPPSARPARRAAPVRPPGRSASRRSSRSSRSVAGTSCSGTSSMPRRATSRPSRASSTLPARPAR